MNDSWYMAMPPNIPLLKCDLGKDAVEYLWKQIEKAKIKNKNANKYLAGNIKESLWLEDEDDYFFNTHLKENFESYVGQYPRADCFRNSFSNAQTNKLILQEFWVNFSKKTEFNPLHNHGGVLSFVIWMKIPTKSEDQHNLPISKNTTAPASSDFMFTYTDILGSIQQMNWEMDPEIEGTMVVFPSTLNHQVYPFFECDDCRVSISGNVYFDVDSLKSSDNGKIEFRTMGLDNNKNML